VSLLQQLLQIAIDPRIFLFAIMARPSPFR
jgi:hypothetical protein